jgi:hypothetical protein
MHIHTYIRLYIHTLLYICIYVYNMRARFLFYIDVR